MAESGDRNAVAKVLLSGLEKAGEISRPVVVKHVMATRRRKPNASPAEIVKSLEAHFTSTVALSGGAAGGAAAVPAVTTGAGVALAVADAGAFSAVAGMYVLAVAEVHGIPTEDVVRRRTLLLGVMLGDSAQATIAKVADRTGNHWAKAAVNKVPVEALRKVNAVLGKNFITKYGSKQGILVLGKAVPFGVGALIGAGGNAAFARFAIKSARRAFGPAPEQFPAHLALLGEPITAETVAFDDIDPDDVIDGEVVR